MESDLPYRAEYAKSGRSSCRGCRTSIEKGTLRLAVMVQSPAFDGQVPNWFHSKCFFNKQRPRTVDDIAHFESLRYDDQETIRSKIQSSSQVVVPTKGKKRDAATALNNKAALENFLLEYSKSSRAVCRGCLQKIMKEEIRISKKDFETDIGKRYGGQDMWHHLTCFAKLRTELGYFECGDKLKGFKTLQKGDQVTVKKELPAIKQEELPSKIIKLNADEPDGVDLKLESQIKKQNKKLFEYRDKLTTLKTSELKQLLEENDQQVPVGQERMMDRLSDIMTFGALEACPTCKDGQLVFNKFGYSCRGDLTEWSTCTYTTKDPKRRAFIVPEELQTNDFLNTYKFVSRKRIIKDVKPTESSSTVKKEEEDEGPKVIREKPPLYNMEFCILNSKAPKDDLKKSIIKLGGKVVTKIKDTVMAVISTSKDVEKLSSRIQEAQDHDIQVVSEDFLTEASDYSGRIPELIIKKNICGWGADPHTRLPAETSTSNLKSTSRFTSSMPSKIKLKLKNGGAVDPDSKLQDCAHIYESGTDKYSTVLGLTDIQKKKNSYYKLQLLASDSGNRFWLFRSWGRIGTTIGGTKLEKFTLQEAKSKFCEYYEEKSGNSWFDRHDFVKVPGRMYPIDLDYGQDDIKLDKTSELTSKLSKPVQKLIEIIFDIDSMKKIMLEFELDTEKMPLGKLSKSQLQNAYTVLGEIQNLIQKNAELPRLVDASNRFYTFVPHSFGIDNPPVINDLEVVKKKIEMIDNLMEMEIAYSLMKSTDDHSIDSHYDKLRTDIEILENASEEFQLINAYVKNTHASTHSNYELNIEQVFKIKRHGEEKRYKPFKKLNNRKLLWHGSRNTNIAGILSQGLRIAPPEAPVTGYMFGKGIYFADMVSKSANYCCTSPNNNTGILLLCEVALGEMHELNHADYVTKLPKGKHSVKGVGMTEPNPTVTKLLPDGVQIPLGEGIKMKRPDATSLLYNEYIVYDVAQVNVKYLLQMDFKYTY